MATNVDLEIRLHNGLKFKNEDPNSLSADESRFKKKIGNATYNTEIAFQYQIRDDEELNKLGNYSKIIYKVFIFLNNILFSSYFCKNYIF